MSELQLHETTVTVDIGGEEIAFTTGKLARQAHGAVTVRSGATVVLATAVGRSEAREGTDFFPLTVDIEEKMYAAGKIPGGFFKREGKASEKATLNARMVDRPIRPLWPKGFRNEVQIIGTVLSIDGEHSHDTLAINGASAALTISPLPFFGPVGAVRIGRIDGQIVVNPLMTQMDESELDLIVCGTMDAITMVEAGAREVSEDVMLQAFDAAHAAIKTLCQAQLDLQAKVGQPKWQDAGVQSEIDSRYASRFDALLGEHGLAGIALAEAEASAAELGGVTGNATEADMVRRVQVRAAISAIGEARRSAAVKSAVEAQFRDALRELSDAEQDSKELKSAKRSALYERIEKELQLPFPSRVDGRLDSLARSYARSSADSVYKQIVREKIAIEKRRPDGRAANEIRPIATEVGVTPRTHGSGLFTRGQTQALTLVTLGTAKEEQRIDDLSLDTKKRYIHHYNFPPFSVGETGFMRGPKRRDIGHGALAERALVPVIPDAETFPYTMRVVSEILESNGSSSMASVCGSTMALMDAGVPITSPVAGIAMGLIKEGDNSIVLTDIQGAEDHLGDMDFKVAGTKEGITALQMDIKITGVSADLLRQALAQAREARLSILESMADGHLRAAHGALAVRPAGRDREDRLRPDRPHHRQGRRDDPRPRGGVRLQDRHRGRRLRPHLRLERRDGRGLSPAHRGDDAPDLGGHRLPRPQGRQDGRVRRVRRAPQGHRRPPARLAHLAGRARRFGRPGAHPRRCGDRRGDRGRHRARPCRAQAGLEDRERRRGLCGGDRHPLQGAVPERRPGRRSATASRRRPARRRSRAQPSLATRARYARRG